MQRVAEYYYKTKDERAEAILDKWVGWIKTVVQLKKDGTYAIPNGLDWSGQPDTWTGTYTGNKNLHVIVTSYTTDLGVTGSLANTLLYYSKASGDDEARVLAKELLDRMWDLYRDDKGLTTPEARADYKRFFEQEIYVPAGWTGKMPNGDVIKSGVKFLDIRSNIKMIRIMRKFLLLITIIPTLYLNTTVSGHSAISPLQMVYIPCCLVKAVNQSPTLQSIL